MWRDVREGPIAPEAKQTWKGCIVPPHSVDIDMENFRPTLMARVLCGAYSSDENDEAMYSGSPPTLRIYVWNYKKWSSPSQSCYGVSLHGAKKIASMI